MYLVKRTEIVSSAKEDINGQTALFITDDIKELEQSNKDFQISGAWQDSYIGSEPQYTWIEIPNFLQDAYQKAIDNYDELLNLFDDLEPQELNENTRSSYY